MFSIWLMFGIVNFVIVYEGEGIIVDKVCVFIVVLLFD